MTAPEDTLLLLDDYLSGALSDAHAEPFEEALFAAAAADRSPELAYLDALFEQARWFRTRGGFMSGAAAAMIDGLRTLPRVHYIDVGAETRVAAWPEDTELVAYRVGVDLRGYENIDVALVTPDGQHRKWFRDVTCDPSDGALYGLCDAPVARAAFRIEPIVVTVRAARGGQRAVVAELNVIPE